MLLRLLPIAPMLVIAAALPTTAAAAVEHEYAAHIDVTSTSKNVQSENAPEKSRNALTSLSTRFEADAPLTFRNGQMTYPQGQVPVTETTNGTAESVYHDSWRDGFSNCTSRISQYATFPDGGFHIDDELGYGAMDVKFSLPKESIGMGKIIQVISGPPASAGDFCPDKNETSTHCSFSWEGQMTLTKVATRTVADDPIDEGDDLIAPLVRPSKASVDAKGKTVSFRAGCAAGCTGTAVLTTPGARAAAKRKPLATLRFRVAPGRARTVTLKLPRKARTALRRAKRGTLAVTLKPKSGAAVRSRLALRLKRR